MSEEQKDVKQEVIAPETAKASAEVKTDAKEEVNEDRAVPYARFKEVIDTKKTLEKKLKETESLVEQKVNETARQYQAYYESELAKLQRQQQDIYATETPQSAPESDVLKREIEMLKSTLNDVIVDREQTKIQTQINQLREVYPELDDEHVLAIKKLNPSMDLQEIAEHSHNKFSNLVKTRFNKMIEKKKEDAKKTVLVSDGKLVLKPEEKPKTLKDAKKMYLKFMEERNRSN